MKHKSMIEALRAELARLEKDGASVEQLQLFCRRLKAHSDLEALAVAHRPSTLARWVNPTSVLLYTAVIAALATLITSTLQRASHENFFRSNIAQAAIASNSPPRAIADKLLLLRAAGIVTISDAEAETLKAEAAKPEPTATP
jgi:hypothetical protein